MPLQALQNLPDLWRADGRGIAQGSAMTIQAQIEARIAELDEDVFFKASDLRESGDCIGTTDWTDTENVNPRLHPAQILPPNPAPRPRPWLSVRDPRRLPSLLRTPLNPRSRHHGHRRATGPSPLPLFAAEFPRLA